MSRSSWGESSSTIFQVRAWGGSVSSAYPRLNAPRINAGISVSSSQQDLQFMQESYLPFPSTMFCVDVQACAHAFPPTEHRPQSLTCSPFPPGSFLRSPPAVQAEAWGPRTRDVQPRPALGCALPVRHLTVCDARSETFRTLKRAAGRILLVYSRPVGS